MAIPIVCGSLGLSAGIYMGMHDPDARVSKDSRHDFMREGEREVHLNFRDTPFLKPIWSTASFIKGLITPY